MIKDENRRCVKKQSNVTKFPSIQARVRSLTEQQAECIHACDSVAALGGMLGGAVDGPRREAAIWSRKVWSRSGRVVRITHWEVLA